MFPRIPTFIILRNENRRSIPKEFQVNNNRFSESLVEFLLERYTKKGDRVLDIFAGLGTTLFVTEQMNRVPYGIDNDKRRFEFVQSHLKLKFKDNLFFGDALRLDEYPIPEMDFCLTSPPYMLKDDEINPLSSSNTNSSYDEYLNDIQKVFSKVKEKMKENSHIVIEVSNLKRKRVTTLAWDIAKRISEILVFEGELVVGWKSDTPQNDNGSYGYGYDHSYCLIYKKKERKKESRI